MNHLPISLSAEGRRALLLGHSEAIVAKARLLARTEFSFDGVFQNADQLSQSSVEFSELVAASGGQLLGGIPQRNEFACYRLCIAEPESIDSSLLNALRGEGVLINVIDQPAQSDFFMPAIVDRSPLSIAISSGGAAPVLVSKLRAQFEALLSPQLSRLVRLAANIRPAVSEALSDIKARRQYWRWFFDDAIVESAAARSDSDLEAQALQALKSESSMSVGEVFLIGAGPGDPELLTLRAHRLLQNADVVLHDRLVSAAVLDLARRDAERVYVGKQRSDHHKSQTEINQLLIDHALQGKRVVRLKGGDPFIFGRGGEEIETLADAGVSFQVIPGVTAASGCAAYAGIPLTHRDHAQSVRFVTGHTKDGKLDLPWNEFQSEGQTLVFYMGLVGLEIICKELIRFGRDENTPAAVVQQGTLASQRVLIGTLKSLHNLSQREQIAAPTIIIIGGVVALHDKLAWFNQSE